MERLWCAGTEAVLRAAGWQPGREVPLDEAAEGALAADGLVLHEAARRFLTEFMGLRLTYPHARVPATSDDCLLDPAAAAAAVFPAWFAEYESRTQDGRLFPIGLASRNHLVLAMGESGAVYGAYDHFLCRVGGSGPEALDRLCSGADVEEMPQHGES